MGEVRVLPVAVTGVRLADAITAFLATVGPANTRRGYAAALNRMRQDVAYFAFLVEQGYPLSEVEAIAVGQDPLPTEET